MGLKILPVFVFLLIASFTFVLAEEKSNGNIDVVLGNATAINDKLQSNPAEIPGPIQKLISDGNILINITRIDGSVAEMYLTVESNKVTGFSLGSPEKSAYDVITNEETVNTIFSSESGSDIMRYYDEGKIKIKAHGLGNNIKLFFAKIFLMFAG